MQGGSRGDTPFDHMQGARGGFPRLAYNLENGQKGQPWKGQGYRHEVKNCVMMKLQCNNSLKNVDFSLLLQSEAYCLVTSSVRLFLQKLEPLNQYLIDPSTSDAVSLPLSVAAPPLTQKMTLLSRVDDSCFGCFGFVEALMLLCSNHLLAHPAGGWWPQAAERGLWGLPSPWPQYCRWLRNRGPPPFIRRKIMFKNYAGKANEVIDVIEGLKPPTPA